MRTAGSAAGRRRRRCGARWRRRGAGGGGAPEGGAAPGGSVRCAARADHAEAAAWRPDTGGPCGSAAGAWPGKTAAVPGSTRAGSERARGGAALASPWRAAVKFAHAAITYAGRAEGPRGPLVDEAGLEVAGRLLLQALRQLLLDLGARPSRAASTPRGDLVDLDQVEAGLALERPDELAGGSGEDLRVERRLALALGDALRAGRRCSWWPGRSSTSRDLLPVRRGVVLLQQSLRLLDLGLVLVEDLAHVALVSGW